MKYVAKIILFPVAANELYSRLTHIYDIRLKLNKLIYIYILIYNKTYTKYIN